MTQPSTCQRHGPLRPREPFVQPLLFAFLKARGRSRRVPRVGKWHRNSDSHQQLLLGFHSSVFIWPQLESGPLQLPSGCEPEVEKC